MRKPRLLDLFCGAGGCSMGYHRAGFEVVGVDINPQPRYPFEFHQADAMTFPLDGFDVIHASPPCQAYCALKTMKNKREHPELVGEMRVRLMEHGRPWVMENVFGAPLLDPIMLCGSHFHLKASNGYELRRHRYFETFPPIFVLQPLCRHGKKTIGIYGAKGRDIAQEKRHYAKPKESRGNPEGVVLPKKYAFEAMGIDWMNMDELSEAIPPAYTEWIGKQLMEVLHD
jgi:DNA (cytosine-5)-methyltransferase 1